MNCREIMAGSSNKKAMISGTVDTMSDLPRNLIDYILERMPVRDAARTSVLSSKWRYIWATHPQLVLDKQFYEDTIKNKRLIHHDFVNIINKILLLHSGPILKFILYIPNFDQNPDIDQWILVLSRSGIKELTLDNSNHNPYKLPSYIFSCPELTHLTLYNFIIKPPHAFRCFRNLIYLHFRRIIFAANILGTLFSNAPFLKILSFVACIGIDHYNIHAPKLRTLSVCGDPKFQSISFYNTPNLISVTIAPCYEVGHPEQGKKATNLIELLGIFPRIMHLKLDGFFLKTLAAGTLPKRLPRTVERLKYLVFCMIDLNDHDQISCALCLLRSSTNLHKLEISFSAVTDFVMEPVLHLLEEPDSKDLTLDRLQVVQIRLYKGFRIELLFIKLLLAHCPLLDRMFINGNGVVDANEGFRISKELMRFSRASTKAEIIYI